MDEPVRVAVPTLAWFGDSELELEFPGSWDVSVLRHKGYGTPALDDSGLREAFARSIGAPTIREGAKGKREICILFDDMSRATPTAEIIPYVLDELSCAGIKDEQIRFIAANGAHAPMNRTELAKKLSMEVMARFLVYSHNPYENCTFVGFSPQGTPMEFNAEVLGCDYKIGIGCIVPHSLAGFSGGGKIILPGVSSMTTIDANHRTLSGIGTGLGLCEGNAARRDINDGARMAGLDIKVDCIYNLRRQVTHLFVGDVIGEHVAGASVAREYWATEAVGHFDIIVANCFSKADEMLIVPAMTLPLRKCGCSDLVLLVDTPVGQVTHYRNGKFGKSIGGRGFRPVTQMPMNTKRITVMQPYPDYAGVERTAPLDKVTFTRSWAETVQRLKILHGRHARVAVIPDATVQYYPSAT